MGVAIHSIVCKLHKQENVTDGGNTQPLINKHNHDAWCNDA